MAPDDGTAIEIDDFKDEFTGCATGECRVSVLPILFQISQIITESEDLSSALTLILGVMEERMKVTRGMVSLYDQQSATIFVHASFGLTEEQKQRGIYSPGEGVTGRVVESGKAVIVPHIGSDPGFLDRTRSRGETAAKNCTFFCVPILHARKVLGTISAERVYANRRLLR
jgi:Nif-specific regulatory protein